VGLDRNDALSLTFGCARPTLYRSPSRPSRHTPLTSRASDRTSINVMCGINLFCMFLLISMIAFVGAIISTCCFVAFLGTLYSDIIGISQFVRLLVVVCRSCCCEYVRNSSPVKTRHTAPLLQE